MSLIYVGPDGARYPLTPAQYAALLFKLRTDPEVSDLDAPGINYGLCTYQKITFSWVYDGAAELTVAIKENHNWKAKLAGNEVVFGKLEDQFIKPVTA